MRTVTLITNLGSNGRKFRAEDTYENADSKHEFLLSILRSIKRHG